jgi:hypothetical protein
MPTVLERIDVGLSGNDVASLVTQQAGRISDVVALVQQLSSSPAGIGDFVGRLDALGPPNFSLSGDVLASFDVARAALPTDLSSLTQPARELLARFGTDIVEQLSPLLGDAVKIAQALQQLLSVRLGCPPSSASGTAPEPPPAAAGTPPASAQRAQAVADQIAQVSVMLDQLPVNVPPIFVLMFILQRLGSKPRDRFFNVNLPVIDDLIEPLQTLTSLSLAAPAAIGTEFAASLTAFTGHLSQVSSQPLGALLSDLGSIHAAVPAVPLRNLAEQLAAAYGSLTTALSGADLAAADAIVVTANGLLDTFEGLRAPFVTAVMPTLTPAVSGLEQYPTAALDRLEHLLSLLQPANFAATLAGIAQLPQSPTDAAMQAVREALQPILDWLNDLLEALNFEAIQAQVASVAGTLRGISNQLTASLTQVGAQAGAMFQSVDDAIAGVDLGELQASLLAQITEFSATLRAQIDAAFAPVRQALANAITQVTTAFEQFDPQVIVGALEAAIQALVDVLSGPEVRGAIDNVKSTVDGVVSALEQLSFAPVTDEVVDLIEQMRSALQTALSGDLNDAAKTAITAGLSALPDDLQPVTEPLIEDFARLIEQGPVSLLERIREEPQKILAKLQQFDPGSLLGDSISQPYQKLTASLDGLAVRALLAPAAQAFDAQKRRLRQTANPAAALQPLNEAFAAITGRLDALSPSALLEPLQQSLQQAIDGIIEASPIDEVFAVVNDVFATINSVLAVIEELRDILQKVTGILASFDNVDAQLDTWRDTLLNNVVAGAGAAIDAALAPLDQALNDVRHADVLAQYDAGSNALLSALSALDPAARLSALVQPYSQAKQRVTALSDSATRAAVLALLARFDPTRASDTSPFRELEVLRAAIVSSRRELESLQTTWNDAVAELENLRTGGSLTGDALRASLAGVIEPALAPVRIALRMIERSKPPIAATLATLEQVFTDLTTRATALLNGPDSLQAISTTVQELVDELRGFDLSVLTDGLEQTLTTVRGQLNALDPARLATALDQAFAAALDALSLDQLIPDSSLTELDAALGQVRQFVTSVDPQKIVTAAVRPLYEDTLLPLAAAFDLTPIFQALIDYLNQLDDELRAELARVNTAYQAFISTRGSSTGATASVGF